MTGARDRPVPAAERARATREKVVAVLFGDGAGAWLFLASVGFLVLTWRVGTFFNDVGLFVPALERLAEGHLSLGRTWEVDNAYPGMHLVDGRVYARNYGELALSLPAYWFVRLVGPVAFRVLVVLAWSALAFGVTVRIARAYGRRRLGVAVGGTVAVGSLVANAVTFRPFVAGQTAIVALQVTTILAAAATGVVLYRLIARRTDTRIGLLAGGVTVASTPVGFWGTVPKRHAFAAMLIVVALYGLARSRDEPAAGLGSAGFRALAYASAGLLTWIHAPEGFTLFLAVAAVDLPTAPSNDRRTLAVVGGAFLLSLVPFFLTNYLVSGNPLEPPRFLPAVRTADILAADPGGSGSTVEGAGGGGSAVGGASDRSPLTVALETALPAGFVTLLQRGLVRYVDGLVSVATDPGRLATVFFRWGRQGYETGNVFFGNGTNLAVLEAAPLAAAVVVAPLRHGVAAVRERTAHSLPALDVADWFVVAVSVLLVALYAPSLPTRVQVTVRYLHPLYPLLVYALFRQAWLRDLVEARAEYVLWGYETAVLLGVPASVGLLLVADVSKGEFLQAFGPVALVVAAALVVSVLAATWNRRAAPAGAFCFGLASGVGTALILLSAFVLMHYGPSALPVVDATSAEVRFAIIRPG